MANQGTRVATLIAVFRQTAKLMVDELIDRLHAAGYVEATAAHHPLFENIDAHGTRLTVLAARAGMTHQSMGELVDELERRGYLQREPDPSDRRARLVKLTSKGRRLVRAAVEAADEIEASWLESLRRGGLDGQLRPAFEFAVRDQARDSELTTGAAS